MTEEHQQRLKELLTVFLAENTKLNLTALRTEEACWTGNIADSVVALDVWNDDYKTVLDIGTGGGFPLLPLAVCLQGVLFTGLDSVGKKVDAIGRIAKEMQLENVHLISGRTEELGRDEQYREQFDVVTARAVAPLNVLIEYASPFVKVGGVFIAWKSMNITKEMEESLLARAELSLHLEAKHPYTLPDPFGQRQLLIFKKGDHLHKKYPRDVGIPKKNPLV